MEIKTKIERPDLRGEPYFAVKMKGPSGCGEGSVTMSLRTARLFALALKQNPGLIESLEAGRLYQSKGLNNESNG